MDWSGGESEEQHLQPGTLPPFPRIWVGYLLGVATLIAEMVAVTLHRDDADPVSAKLTVLVKDALAVRVGAAFASKRTATTIIHFDDVGLNAF